jgi:GntR family transcriptional regulator, transcriptional repressor for pyruvate dehydrogenase complex
MSIGLMWGADAITVTEMLEAREVLEVPAARMAAERRQDHHVDQMWEAIDRETRSRGRAVKFREHRTFHGVIVQAAGNGLLELMTDPVFRVLQTKFLDPDVPASFWAVVDDDHRTITEAIRDRDGDAAAAALHEHLVRLREVYRDLR